MDETEREAFYDAEVAPVLNDLSKRCLANGLSFLAGAAITKASGAPQP